MSESADYLTTTWHPANFASSESEGISGRWRAYDDEALVKRDKISLDIFWLKDESLSDSDNLPAPDVIAQEIVVDQEAALAQFREILSDVGECR